jgi:acetyl-CoA carboxylase carboxyltransferase component
MKLKGVRLLKKVIIAGVGVALLLGGGFYGMKTVSAAGNQSNVVANAPSTTASQHGKKAVNLSQYKDQIHQLNKLREDHLDLQKQLVEKQDQLLDLTQAAKTSGNKDKMKQAKPVRQQLTKLNREMKPLVKESNTERKALKVALKNGSASDQYNKLIATNQQINDKMKQISAELDQLISILK